MIFNLNARLLSNGAVFVSYDKGGKRFDAAFMSWDEFVAWLTKEVKEATC